MPSIDNAASTYYHEVSTMVIWSWLRPERSSPSSVAPQAEPQCWDDVYATGDLPQKRRPQLPADQLAELNKPKTISNCFTPASPEFYATIDNMRAEREGDPAQKRTRRRLREMFDDFLTNVRRFARSLVPRGSETLDADEPEAPADVPQPQVPAPLVPGIYEEAPAIYTNQFGMTQYTYSGGDHIIYDPFGNPVSASVNGTLYERLEDNLWRIQRPGSDKWEEVAGTLVHEGTDTMSMIAFFPSDDSVPRPREVQPPAEAVPPTPPHNPPNSDNLPSGPITYV